MNTTGIVRRVDELGRVVIPKELRRTLKIREGEEVEVFVKEDNTLMLKKYSAVKESYKIIDNLVKSISKILNIDLLVIDKDEVISANDNKFKIEVGDKITYKLETIIDGRKQKIFVEEEVVSFSKNALNTYKYQIVTPIIYNGDVLGGIVYLDSERNNLDLISKISLFASQFISNIL